MRGRDMTANRLLILKKRVGRYFSFRTRDSELNKTMLITYTSQTDIPEAFRDHYKLIEGKWTPEISDDHPVKLNNVKLLGEKSTTETNLVNAKTKITELEGDLTAARSSSGLSRGQRAVSIADAEFVDQAKTHGTPAEVLTKLSEHKTLKEDSDKRSREDHLRKVAKVLGYDNADAFVMLSNLPEFEIRQKDGKDIVVAKVKDGANVVEKPQTEIDSLPAIAPFVSALKTRTGVYAPEQRRDNAPPVNDIFSNIRKSVQETEKAAMPPSAVEQRFGIQKTA